VLLSSGRRITAAVLSARRGESLRQTLRVPSKMPAGGDPSQQTPQQTPQQLAQARRMEMDPTRQQQNTRR